MKDKSKRLTVINTSVTEKSDSPGSDSTNRKPSISPIGLNTTGNFLLKSTWNEAWEIKSNEEGRKYIYGKLPLVLQYGLTMYAGEDGVNIPSIYDGLPIDSQTIYWEDIKDGNGVVIGKILKAKTGGGTLGSLTNVGEWADSVADVDRIMVQKKGSDTWEAMDVSGIGSASFENISESGEGNAYTSFELSEDKKSLTLVKGETFALASDLEDKWTTDEELINNWNTAFGWGNHAEAGYALQISLDLVSEKLNNFLEGSDTDSIINKWKELEAFLDGLSESDNLAEILSSKANQSALEETNRILATKWTKDDTKIANWDAAFSWGDHSKAGYAAKSYVDSTFVPIKGDCNIEGIKNFIGTLQVNGSPIVYDKEKGYWYFTGDMIVSGGITMFGNPQGFEPSTIMDGVHVDGVTIIKENGRLVALGGGGSGGSELDTVAWENVLGKPSWITNEKPECVNPFSLSWNGRETGSYNGSMGKSFYIPAKLSELTDDVVSGKYLPLSGGTVTGSSVAPLTINSTNSDNKCYIPFTVNGVIKAYVGYSSAVGAFLEVPNGSFRVNTTGITYNGNTVYHAGNFNPANYLPLSGGTIQVDNVGKFNIYNTAQDGSYVHFYATINSAKTDLGYIGINKDKVPTFMTLGGVCNTIWHAGNDGSGSGLDADTVDNVHLMGKGGRSGIMRSWARGTYTTSKQYFGNGNVVVMDPKPTDDSNLWANTTIFSLGDMEVRSHQLAFGYDTDVILYRRVYDGPTYNSWKTLAFTDSNVASASKLQTPRTIWGQSFDGSGNVSGTITVGYSSADIPAIQFSKGEYIDGHGNIYFSENSGAWNFFDKNKTILFRLTKDGSVLMGGRTTDDYKGVLQINTASTRNAISLYDTSRPETSIMYTGNDGYTWIVGKGVGSTGDAFGVYREGVKFLINYSGKVGIGTTNPTCALDVNGSISVSADANITGDLRLKGSGNYGNTLYFGDGSYCYITEPSDDAMKIYGSKGVTIDGGVTYGLSVVSMASFTDNVGIGTTSPSAKLHVAGNILATGGITMYSQRSLKNVVDERGLSLSELSEIKPTRYTWKDNRDNRIHFGGIADDIQQVLPEVVYKTKEGVLTMDYGNAGFAIASSLIKPVVDHEEKISQLQKRVSELEQELNRLRA